MGLRASEHKTTLLILYFVTLVMRASFYLTIAVIQSSSYMDGQLEKWVPAMVLMIYPLVELSTVSYFGAKSDQIGRRPILVMSLFITSIAALLFAIGDPAINLFDLRFIEILMLVFAAVFGLGVASKVTTTLSMIADSSTEDNRARLMGYYDLSTLMGLAGGYGMGILFLQFGFEAFPLLLAASGACAFSGLLAYFFLGETRQETHIDVSMIELIKKVASDRRVQLMLPVYVPIISLYGLMIANVEHILEAHFTLSNIDLITLFGMLGGSLILGIIVMGHLSDHFRKRKPFIVSGLISFGFLAYILIAYVDNFEAVWEFWPALPILGFIAGGFPPAAMAYLTDISEE
ncbi:MAG: MFS transporter, partial [Candidatus Thorarchaeota archaeon]